MEKGRIVKIGFIGSAGGGKSIVALDLSKHLNVPFLRSKDITRPILKRYGYVYSADNCVEVFLSKKSIEFEIVDQRIYEENLLQCGFVTDRTNIESFCYAFLNLSSYNPSDLELLENLCKESIIKYDKLFYFPWNGGWLEDNGVRTLNSYLQRHIDMMIRGIIIDWNLQSKVVFIPVDTMVSQKTLSFIEEKLNI